MTNKQIYNEISNCYGGEGCTERRAKLSAILNRTIDNCGDVYRIQSEYYTKLTLAEQQADYEQTEIALAML